MLEGSPAGAVIPLRRETVAAFVGPAPRGPAHIPVAIRSVAEFLQRFGSPEKPSRMEHYLRQFFHNGGSLAIVVRVCRDEQCNRIRLPAAGDQLVLEALHPGPLEHLRASVDYDQIGSTETGLFNLVIHRLDAAVRGLVVEQEIWRRISADPLQSDFVGDALLNSDLVRLVGDGPGQRPEPTLGSGSTARSAWIEGEGVAGGFSRLSDYDLIGSAAEGTGLFALEQVPVVDLLCLVPPAPGDTLGPVAWFAAERYCRRRQALLLMEPPAAWESLAQILDDQHRQGLASPNVMTWYPQLDQGGAAGAIAGALVTADALEPNDAGSAPLPLRGCGRPMQRLTLMETAALGRAGVNSMLPSGSGRLTLSGGTTLARAGGLPAEWSDLRLRRRVLFILGGIVRGSRWALFRSDDPGSVAELRVQLEDFLEALRADGQLAGSRPAESWFLQLPVQPDGPLELQLGLALRRPGDFLAFRLTHGPADCEVRELGWQPGLALAS